LLFGVYILETKLRGGHTELLIASSGGEYSMASLCGWFGLLGNITFRSVIKESLKEGKR
jgi:hypothetical protein